MCAPPALADTGVGDVLKPVRRSVAANEPLSSFGSDAVRVSYEPALSTAWTVQLHPQDADTAVGVLTIYGHDRLYGWLQLRLRRSDYDKLVAQVDAIMAQGSAPKPAHPKLEDMVVCTDGVGDLTERRRNGKTTWLSKSDCDDGVSAADIPTLVVKLFPDLCEVSWRGFPDLCKPPAPPG